MGAPQFYRIRRPNWFKFFFSEAFRKIPNMGGNGVLSKDKQMEKLADYWAKNNISPAVELKLD